jgi:hypothetical protein
VENAVDLMFRSTDLYRRGEDHSRLLDVKEPADRPLHPMTFVSCGQTRIWSGESPAILKRMWSRGGVRPTASGARALVWVVWGTISPKSLRFFLRSVLHARNLIARPLIGNRDFVEWRPADKSAHRQRATAQEAGRLAVTK